MDASKIFRLIKLNACFILFAFFFSSFQCSGDEVSCTVLSAKYAVKVQEIANSFSAGSQVDCAKVQELYDVLYKVARDGKDCANIKAALDAAGFSSVDELISKYDLKLADAGC